MVLKTRRNLIVLGLILKALLFYATIAACINAVIKTCDNIDYAAWGTATIIAVTLCIASFRLLRPEDIARIFFPFSKTKRDEYKEEEV